MIARETVERVREHTDLVALVGETVKLTRRGRSWVGLCPFHKEKSPSFHVSPERGYFHCFGCKESGSAIDFVMKTEGLAFVEAVRQLAERAGIEIEETRTVAERKHEEAARRDRDELYGVLAFAATYFEHCLRGGPASPFAGAPHPYASLALRALEERGLSPSGEGGGATSAVDTALQAFRVGYAPFGWEGLARTLTKQGLALSVAEKVGLIVPRAQGSGRGHYDRFRHRLMFAVLDVQGRVVAFSGRALPEPGPAEVARIPEALRGRVEVPDGRAGEPPAKYLNSPESPVYTKGQHLFGLFQARHAIRRAGEALLVEGNFDVVALHARGIENVVAPLGTAFTDEQAALLRRFAPKVVLMFDADAAGRKATYAARVPARAAGLSVRVADLPAGMDPDELARKRGAEAVTRAAKEAAGLLEHLIDKALDELGMEAVTLDGQLRRVRKVAELLAEEADPELRTLAKAHADRLSSKLAVGGAAPLDLRQLERMLERALQAGGAPDEPTHEGPTGPAARSSLGTARIQEELLGALVDAPELVNDPEVRAELDVLEGDTALALAALRRLVDARGAERFGLYASDFLAQVPHSIQGFVVARMAAPRFESPSDAKWGALANARKLKRRSLVRENEPEKHDLARAIAEGDTARAALIAREMSERARLRERLGH